MTLNEHSIRLFWHKHLAMLLFRRITEDRTPATMSELNKHIETIKAPLFAAGVLALGAAVVNEYIEGGRNIATRRTATELCTNDLVGAEATVIGFAGCMQKGEDTFDALRERTEGVNIIVPSLPEYRPDGRIDEEALCMKIIDRLIATKSHKPHIIADSRGILDAKKLIHFAHDTGASREFGGFGTVIANASPHDGEDITRSRNLLLNGAITFQHFRAPERIKPTFMKLARHAASADAPFTKIAVEGLSIRQAPKVDRLPAIIDEFIYIHGLHDPTVLTKQAVKKFQLDAPEGTFREYIDSSRGKGHHIGGMERFDLMLNLAGVEVIAPQQLVVPQFELQPAA